jgi:diadenylate cyclase
MDRVADEVIESTERQHPRLLGAIYSVAPGTSLREGIDSIVDAGTGGLIVVGDLEEFGFMLSGGIRLDVDFNPALLYELAKMDGAIVVDSEVSKILWANVQMLPDPTIQSSETGTRHRTAERISRQVDALVIAVSRRRDVVSIFVDGNKYVLEAIPSVLAKANQAMAALATYRERLDQLCGRLTRAEFDGTAVLYDALSAIQRSEMVRRVADEVERYIVELGSEGRLIEIQLEETLVGVSAVRTALIRDYAVDDSEGSIAAISERIAALPHHELLDFGTLAESLGYDRKLNTLDFDAEPRGYRVLAEVPRLPRLAIQGLVHRFGSLEALRAAPDEALDGVEGVGPGRSKDIRESLRRVGEGAGSETAFSQ